MTINKGGGSTEYKVIEIWTSDAARYRNTPVPVAVVDAIRTRRLAGRVHVYHGMAAAYESGELASPTILDIAANLPVKIEVLVPSSKADEVLSLLGEMVTEGVVGVRPIDVRVHRSEQRLLPRHLRVADVMTHDPVAVTSQTPVIEVVRILGSRPFRGVPVLDARGQLAGIITEDDLVRRARLPVAPGLLAKLQEDDPSVAEDLARLEHMPARAIMTQPAMTVWATAHVHEAVQKMVRYEHRTLPVVDATGRLVGMISRLDVLRAVSHHSEALEPWQGTELRLEDAQLVRDAVTGKDRKVLPTASLLEVARLIATTGFRRYALVETGGRLVGVVTESDLLRVLEPDRKGFWAYLLNRFLGAQPPPSYMDQAERLQTCTAAQVSPKDLVVAEDEEPLGEAVTRMVKFNLKELPVVDASGRFAGFLSRRDFMRAIAGR